MTTVGSVINSVRTFHWVEPALSSSYEILQGCIRLYRCFCGSHQVIYWILCSFYRVAMRRIWFYCIRSAFTGPPSSASPCGVGTCLCYARATDSESRNRVNKSFDIERCRCYRKIICHCCDSGEPISRVGAIIRQITPLGPMPAQSQLCQRFTTFKTYIQSN